MTKVEEIVKSGEKKFVHIVDLCDKVGIEKCVVICIELSKV